MVVLKRNGARKCDADKPPEVTDCNMFNQTFPLCVTASDALCCN